jgi:hypothetical protein
MNMLALRRLSGLLAPAAALAAALAFGSTAQAVTFDFDVADDYNLNFQRTWLDTGSSGAFGYNAGLQALRHTSTGSGTAVFAYDTIPDATITNKFTDISVSFDFSVATAGASVGVYFGGASRTSANLAILNINNTGTSNDLLRFFTGGNTTSGTAGTQFGSTTTLTGGGWTVGTTYRATLDIDYVTATTANVTFTVSDPYTVSGALTSFSATATGITVASGGGEIAFRTGFTAGAPTGSNVVDNIAIGAAAVPEPSAFAALGGLAALGLAATRRRRVRA